MSPPPSLPFDPSTLLPSTNNSPCPFPDRATTNAALDALLKDNLRPSPSNVFGSGPLILSDVPKNIIRGGNGNGAPNEEPQRGVIMGIDEAGRGPVLGPMTYAAAYWLPQSEDDKPTKDSDPNDYIPKGLNDSKQLTSEKRAKFFAQIRSSNVIGFVLRVLHASEISRNQLRKVPHNLNAMSHEAAMEMIWAVLDAGVKIDTCYIDTVGDPNHYRRKLDRVFEGRGISFVVEKKADAKFETCSAASVVAKEARDAMTTNWKWNEPNYEPQDSCNFGSGYPSDQKCMSWLKKNTNVDAPFGYPDFVRFSWNPAKNALDDYVKEKRDAAVKWEADEDGEDESGGKQASMDAFMVVKKVDSSGKKGVSTDSLSRKRPRTAIFNEMGLARVYTFVGTS